MSDNAPVRYIDAMTRHYRGLGYEPYRWYTPEEPAPWAPLARPLSEARLGVLTTAGAYVPGQVAFHYRDDASVRAVPVETPVEDVHFAHLTENWLVDARRDPGCLVPLDALRAARDDGEVGALADDVLSCMGAVYSQRRVRDELAPELTARFEAQAVDAVLLIPM